MRSVTAGVILLGALSLGCDAEDIDRGQIDRALHHPGSVGLGKYTPSPEVLDLANTAWKSAAVTEALIQQLRKEAVHETCAEMGIDGGGSSGLAMAYAITSNASVEEEPHIVQCFADDVFPSATSLFVAYLLREQTSGRKKALADIFDIPAFDRRAKDLGLSDVAFIDMKSKERAFYATNLKTNEAFSYEGLSKEALELPAFHVRSIKAVLGDPHADVAFIHAIVAAWMNVDDASYWRIVYYQDGTRLADSIAAYAPTTAARLLLKLKTQY